MFAKTLAQIDELRSLDHTLIGAGYVAVGAAFQNNARIICITNATEGDMLFTDDVTKDKLYVAKGSFKLFDIQANTNGKDTSSYVGPKNWRWYVKQITAPVSGKVYVEVVY